MSSQSAYTKSKEVVTDKSSGGQITVLMVVDPIPHAIATAEFIGLIGSGVGPAYATKPRLALVTSANIKPDDYPDLLTFITSRPSFIVNDANSIVQVLNAIEANADLAIQLINSIRYKEKIFNDEGLLVNTLMLNDLQSILKAPLTGVPSELIISNK